MNFWVVRAAKRTGMFLVMDTSQEQDVSISVYIFVRCAHFDVSDAIVACALLHVRSFMWQDIMEYTSTIKLLAIMRHVLEIFS